MLKEIGRKSVLWLCLAVGLLAGGTLNLLATGQMGCGITYDTYENVAGREET